MISVGGKTWTLTYKRWERPSQMEFFKHTHQDYEILYIVEGDAEYNVDGRSFRLRPHDIVFIPPARYHWLHLLSDAPYERYVFNFEARILPVEGQERLATLPTVMNAADTPRLSECFFRLRDYYAAVSDGDFHLLARSSLREILINMFYSASSGEVRRARRNPIIDRVISLIDGYPERDWDAASLSAELFLSKSYLQNLFSRYMDIGLKQYINSKKILYAQSLLQTGMRATDVCEACGFRDYSTFYRLFRKLTGISPAAVTQEE